MCLIYHGEKPTGVPETFTAYKVYEVTIGQCITSPVFRFRKGGKIFGAGTIKGDGIVGSEKDLAIYKEDNEKNLYPVEDEVALKGTKVNVYAFHCLATKEDAEKYIENAKFYYENKKTGYAIVPIQLVYEDIIAWGYTPISIKRGFDTYHSQVKTYCVKKITITEEDFNNAIKSGDQVSVLPL